MQNHSLEEFAATDARKHVYTLNINSPDSYCFLLFNIVKRVTVKKKKKSSKPGVFPKLC